MSEQVTIKEAAELCGVKPGTVSKWLSHEKIRKYTAPNGYHVRIDKEELQRFDLARRLAPEFPAERA